MKRFNYFDVSMQQILLFLSVAQERNFSKVSEKMNIAQPALSKKIAGLEETLGLKLFERASRPVRLTPAGAYLFSEWTALLEAYENSIEKACDLRTSAEGGMSIGCLDSLNPRYSFAIQAFCEAYPKLNCRVEYCQFSEMRQKLVDGHIDMAFWPRSTETSFGGDFCHKEVFSSPMLACMLKNNPLSAQKSITIHDLRGQKFILISPEEKADSADFLLRICRKAGFTPGIARYVPNAHALILALRGPDEVVLCDHFLSGIDHPQIAVFELEGIQSIMDVVWKKDNKNPWLALFAEKIGAFL